MHKSLGKLGVPIEISSSSEIEVDAIIDYAAIHIEKFRDMKFEYPTEVEMRDWLIAKNIGYSFEKNKSSIPRLKKDKLYNVYKASILLNNFGDISKIKPSEIPDFDLMNFSFSCTDLSNAGKQKGMRNEDGTPTRSGLYVYGMNIIKEKEPKYVMIENVKGLIQKKFIDDFYSIIDELKELGYNCYYPTKEDKKGNILPTCLNAKNYGIPQNRERIFVICVRNDIESSDFDFPKGFDSGIRLKDILEESVNEKYYLSQEIQNRFKLNGKEDVCQNELNVVGSSAPECRTIGQRDITYGTNGIMSTLTATDYKQPKQIVDKIGGCFGNHQAGSVYNSEALAPTLDTMQGGYRQPCIIDEKYYLSNNMKKYILDVNDTQKGTKWEGRSDNDCLNSDIAHTISVRGAGGGQRAGVSNFIIDDYENEIKVKQIKEENKGNIEGLRIRKLTPKECFRLMGFDDEDFDKCREIGTSDSALYKQAGNSIVVNVLYYIFKNLFKEYIVENNKLNN